MEHIVQFGIGIDDEAIVERIHKNAEKNITSELLNDVKKIIFECNWNGSVSNRPSDWTESRINSFLENHKDEIIELAGKYLAEKLSRTKVGKDLLQNADK